MAAPQPPPPPLPLSSSQKRRWPGFVPLFVALVVVAEIAFLGRLDMAKNAALVETWTNSFYFPSSTITEHIDGGDVVSDSSSVIKERIDGGDVVSDSSSLIEERIDRGYGFSEEVTCEEWLEKEDGLTYSRDFNKDPILVAGGHQEWDSCSVGCKFGFSADKTPDATFGLSQSAKTASVLRSMESSHYYPENNVDNARRRGFKIVMTTSLSSDVPVGYFSWAEYDIMAPLQPKSEEALAAAFISNCGARNFRLAALQKFEELDIKIDSYGSCHHNRDGHVDKIETLKRYKFSLAFENSNEEDYVTEKFFQSLVAGTIPVVVGAPNIQDFAPAPGSILHIKEFNDVVAVAKKMKTLASDSNAYNQSIRWKYDGPSDSFKALIDMAAVHSSCRLCLHLATLIQQEEEKTAKFQNRPCRCNNKQGTVYHLYVRERGRFQLESIYLRSAKLTLNDLEFNVLAKFKSLNHTPIWKKERPESIRGGTDFKVYRIYPVGLTQRRALYTFKFKNDADLRNYIESNPCAKLEVIFV